MAQTPIALTMGEPSGIGGEITLKAWLAARSSGNSIAPFFAIDSRERLTSIARATAINVPAIEISDPAETADVFAKGVPVLALTENVAADPGRPAQGNAKAVLQSIDMAIDRVSSGTASAMVTNPIQKAPLMAAGFAYPGHTDYLRHRAGNVPVTMMLASPLLRVALATIHIPLKDVPGSLTVDGIVEIGRLTAQALRGDFGVTAPRLAVSGLNPHAGEDGALGREDIEIIAPAVEQLQREGIDATGPFPADTMFHPAARARYDAALCMYHDQGLVPLKTLDFDRGVNVTLGLPWIRTSPDHGTALDIAGTGKANPSSLIAALEMAAQMAANRHAAA